MAKTISKSGPKGKVQKEVLGVNVRKTTKDALIAYAKSIDRSVSYVADSILTKEIEQILK